MIGVPAAVPAGLPAGVPTLVLPDTCADAGELTNAWSPVPASRIATVPRKGVPRKAARARE